MIVIGGAELITEEWLREIGFDDCKPSHVWGTPNANWWSESDQIEIYNHNDSGDWLWVEYDSISMRTRRDLMLLIEWVRAGRAGATK